MAVETSAGKDALDRGSRARESDALLCLRGWRQLGEKGLVNEVLIPMSAASAHAIDCMSVSGPWIAGGERLCEVGLRVAFEPFDEVIRSGRLSSRERGDPSPPTAEWAFRTRPRRSMVRSSARCLGCSSLRRGTRMRYPTSSP